MGLKRRANWERPCPPVTAIAPRPTGDPRYLCRFATERTLSTDTADAVGNATLLSS
jgi:hypothetical protein